MIPAGVLSQQNPPISTRYDFLAQKFREQGTPASFDDVLALTRPSAKWTWGNDGQLHSAASGEPAFEYDPSTGEALGLLVNHESVTNTLTNSLILQGPTPATYSASTIPGPFNSSAARYTVSEEISHPLILRSFVYSADIKFVEFIVRNDGTPSALGAYLVRNNTTSTNLYRFDYTSVVNGTWLIRSEILVEKWKVFVVKLNPADFTNGDIVALYFGSTSFSPIGSYSDVYYGAAINRLTNNYTIIPTSGASATQAADVLSLDHMPADYGSEGAFYLEWQNTQTTYAGTHKLLTDGSSADWFRLSDDCLTLSATDGTNIVSTTVSDTDVNKAVIYWNGSDMKLCANGGTVYSDAHNGNLGSASACDIFSEHTGRLRQLRYYPGAMSEVRMQELTT